MFSTATIRAAILDVIDGHRYRLYESIPESGGITEDFANSEQVNFVSAVIERIKDFEPNAISAQDLANLCDRHKRERLPSPTVSTCADCARESRNDQDYKADLAKRPVYSECQAIIDEGKRDFQRFKDRL